MSLRTSQRPSTTPRHQAKHSTAARGAGPANAPPPPARAGAKAAAATGTATTFTRFSKDAKQASMANNQRTSRGRVDPQAARRARTQAIADKAAALFGAGGTLTLSALQFGEVIGALQKSGILNQSASKALKEIFALAKRGASSSALQQRLATVSKEFGAIGKVLTVIAGTLSIGNELQKGNYTNAFKELYSTLAGLSLSAPRMALNAVQTILREAVPGHKGSVADKLLGAVDLVEMGRTGVDALAEVAKQLTHLHKHGKIDAASLGRLVARMRKGGAAYAVKLGEYIGAKMYHLPGPKVGAKFAALWLVLNDPNTRLTPSQSSKIAAVMGKLSEQMNSQRPDTRKQATKMAHETLTKLLAQAQTDPQCRKGLHQWYGYLRSTASQGFGKYRALLRQCPQQMQALHTQWRRSCSWLMRLFIGKTAPRG